MRRLPFVSWVLLAGCAQVLSVDEFRGDDDSGAGPACGTVADCPTPSGTCKMATCEEGRCFVRAADGRSCGEGYRCNAEAKCLLDLGAECTAAHACQSGYCESSVCCDRECGPCSDCADGPLTGTCTPRASGAVEPGGACEGARCDGLGHCATGETSAVTRSGIDAGLDRGYAVARRSDGGWVVGGLHVGAIAPYGGAPFDALLLQFAADGSVASTTAFGGIGGDVVYGVAVDAADDAYAVGVCSSGAVPPGVSGFDCAGAQSNSFVMKSKASGEVAWARVVDNTPEADALEDVVAAPDGGVIVVGYGGGASPGRGARLARLDAQGNTSWTNWFTSSGFGMGFTGVALAPDGDIVASGFVRGTASILGAVVQGQPASEDVLVVRLDPTGQKVRWARVFGGLSSEVATDVAVAPDGSVGVVGYFGNAMTVTGNITLNGNDGLEGFVLLLDGVTGTYRWASPILAPNETVPNAVAFDGASNLIVAGIFNGAAGAPGGKASLFGGEIAAAGAYDGFVVKVTSAGLPLWRRALGGPWQDLMYGVWVESDGVFVAGSTSGGFVLGDKMISTAANGEDLSVFRLDP